MDGGGPWLLEAPGHPCLRECPLYQASERKTYWAWGHSLRSRNPLPFFCTTPPLKLSQVKSAKQAGPAGRQSLTSWVLVVSLLFLPTDTGFLAGTLAGGG